MVYISGLKKYAFYCVPLSPEFQELFTFGQSDLETNMKQYSRMVLPQEFLNVPTILEEVVVHASWRPQSRKTKR